MISSSTTAESEALPAISLIPQDRPSRGRNVALSMVLSLAVLAVVVREISGIELHRLPGMIPTSPLFWIVFALSYLVTPASEWLIFRHLWRIPPGGIVPLLRKKVYNELLLGYLGEAYFYSWARRRVRMTTAPFGAVKDVAILSAMTGNAVTLGLLAFVVPTQGIDALGVSGKMLFLSLGLLTLISLAAMVFRGRIFSLAREELAMITRVHLARIVLSTVLLAILWHLVLPAVALSLWFYLSTLRLLVSRLPLVPNKDLLFAGITVVVLGHDHDIGALMALMAGLILATHLVLGLIIAVHDLASPEARQ